MKTFLALAILAQLLPNFASADGANRQSDRGLRPIQDTGGDSFDLPTSNPRTGAGQSGRLSAENAPDFGNGAGLDTGLNDNLDTGLESGLEVGLDDGLSDDSAADPSGDPSLENQRYSNPAAERGLGFGDNRTKSRRQSPESSREYRSGRGSDHDHGRSWDRAPSKRNHGHGKGYGQRNHQSRDHDRGRSWDRGPSGRNHGHGKGYGQRNHQSPDQGHGKGYGHRNRSVRDHGLGAGQGGRQAKKWNASPKRKHRR
ncbi:MAG: hypothetical protein LBJ61_11760 [Deltaproteobacteria bacterium]|nr:hypothetical protein [Deltaproteobacteria bacterium]